MRTRTIIFANLVFVCSIACDGQPPGVNRAAVADLEVTQTANPSGDTGPSTTAGFDGARAYEHVRQLVAIGSRSPGSDGIHRAQGYIIGQLKSFGCKVEEHDFRGSTPLGDVAMKNIVAKIPGTGSNIVLYATHYDNLRMAHFVGADDGGSGTGTMLELARIFCARKRQSSLNVWIVFFDGEEAQGEWTDKNSVQWTNTNSTFGSREMAASMSLSGDLKRLKAMILADMIGPSDLKIKRDSNSTPWLTDTIWAMLRDWLMEMFLLTKARAWAVTITSRLSVAVFLAATSSISTSRQLIGTLHRTHWTKLIRTASRLSATFSSRHCLRWRRNSTEAEASFDYYRAEDSRSSL